MHCHLGESRLELRKQLATSSSCGRRERPPWCGHAGGIPLCCSLSFSFSSYLILFLSRSPLILALTDKEKTQYNLWSKSYLEVASESLNTRYAENHAGKIQVYYCIRYLTSVKVATSSLSEGRNQPALGSLSHVAFASGRRPMWNILLSSIFLLCLRLVESSSSIVNVGGRVEKEWMCCWQQSPGSTKRVFREHAALGFWVLFSALAEMGFVPCKHYPKCPKSKV